MKKGIEAPISVIASLVIITIVIVAVLFFFITGMGRSSGNIAALQNVTIVNLSERIANITK